MLALTAFPAQDFAVNLQNRVSAIHEVPPPRSFTFLSDACRGLEQARKVWGGAGWGGRCAQGSGGLGEGGREGGRSWREAASVGSAAWAPQVLAYACVYSFYNQDTEHMDVVEQQTEALELHTNALQILLGEAPAHSVLSPASSPSTHPRHTNGWVTRASCPPLFCPLPVLHSLITVTKFQSSGTQYTALHPTFALVTTCPHL